MRKLSKVIISVMLLSVLVTGCGKDASEKKEEKKVIRAATTDEDMEEMLLTSKDALKKAGYDLEIQMFSGDYVAPNIATNDGKIDINFFQHVPYLVEFNKNHNTKLEPVGQSIFYSTMGLFSDKIQSLDEVKKGMSIAISSDATNRTRALRFMESMGFIKLKPGLDVYTKLDVEENKYDLEIVEMDIAMIPKSIPDMDLVIVYPYDVELAGYDLKAIEYDPAEIGSGHGIVLVTTEENKDTEWAKIMQEALESEQTKEVVKKYYGETGKHVLEY